MWWVCVNACGYKTSRPMCCWQPITLMRSLLWTAYRCQHSHSKHCRSVMAFEASSGDSGLGFEAAREAKDKHRQNHKHTIQSKEGANVQPIPAEIMLNRKVMHKLSTLNICWQKKHAGVWSSRPKCKAIKYNYLCTKCLCIQGYNSLILKSIKM